MLLVGICVLRFYLHCGLCMSVLFIQLFKGVSSDTIKRAREETIGPVHRRRCNGSHFTIIQHVQKKEKNLLLMDSTGRPTTQTCFHVSIVQLFCCVCVAAGCRLPVADACVALPCVGAVTVVSGKRGQGRGCSQSDAATQRSHWLSCMPYIWVESIQYNAEFIVALIGTGVSADGMRARYGQLQYSLFSLLVVCSLFL